MTFHHLSAHPDYGSAIQTLTVEVLRPSPERLRLRFVAEGPIERIVLPDPAPPRRKDDLWRATCFEAFLRPMGSTDYLELNFSPSGEWAAYAFEDYRSGMRDAPVPEPPHVELTLEPKCLVLDVTLVLDLPPRPHALGLSAILEEADEARAFWALAHPPGVPDFHHTACFAADLPPPERA